VTVFPPPDLLRSAWFPLIARFVRVVINVAQVVPGLSVSSWFRTPDQNRRVGGSPESQHLFALGLDITGSQDSLRQVIFVARGLGLEAFAEPDHVHLQLFPKGALSRAGVIFPQ